MIKRVFHDITNINRKNFKLTIHKSSHRKKLLRWLYEVTRDFEYSQITYAMALSILDSYTVKYGFDLSEYQLIGITSLFIAAKMEESFCKPINEYVDVTDNYVSKDEILNMEREMVKCTTIDHEIPHSYLKTWYLERMTDKFTLKERRELLFCAFALILERNEHKTNVYKIYLDGIREVENVLSSNSVDEDMKFYIENNPNTKKLIKELY